MRRTKLAAVVAFWAAFVLLPAAGPLAAGGGGLDPSFGSAGKTVLDGIGAEAVGVAPDGKIVVVSTANDSFTAARLNADGSPDTSFDTDGRLEIDVSPGLDQATAVAFGPGGTIVIAGYAGASVGAVRLEEDGSPDPTFDGDGKVVVDLGGFGAVRGVAVDSLGRVVIGGDSDFGAGFSDFALVRLTTTGALDLTFDGDGIVRTDVAGSRDDLFALALQPDGKIVAGGAIIVGGQWDFGAVRYLETGALDPTFSGDGKATIDFGSNDIAWGLGVGPGGTIALGGYTGPCCTFDFVAARLLADGTPDPGFAGDGRADPVNLGGADIGFDATVDSDGRVIVVGSKEAAGDFDWGVVRYAADGTLDTGFATGGIAPSPFATGFARAFGVALQPDGKVVVVGSAEDGGSSGAGVARYLSDSAAPNAAPTASFTVSPSSGTTATSFSFDGSGSSDPDGDALTYAWAFGDGGSGAGATTTYAYAAAGSYTATLTVSDGRGGSGSTTRAVTVTAPPPANLIVDDDGAQCPTAAHTTIQSAVDAAAPGATVTVCAGSYGGVTVAKQLTLRGPSADTSRAATCASAIVGATTDAIVSGATITLAASGIDLRGFVIKDATTGLVTDGAGSGYTVANNLFEGSYDGMHFASGGASPSAVRGNCFREHTRAAIFSIAVPVKNAQIEDNAFVDNGNNGGDGWAMALGEFRFGDSLIRVEDVTIARNTSEGDNRFIEIPGSRDVIIEDNESDGAVTSVFLANNNIGTRVSDNSFADGQTGIYVSSIGPFGGLPNRDLVITGNDVTGMSGQGIATETGASMLDSMVSGNTSSGNAVDGIFLANGSTGNSVSGNTLSANLEHDCHDDTSGAGTADTANTWSGNTASTETPSGLCVAQALPTVSIADVSVIEGDTGTTSATFTITRSSGTGSSSVDYVTGGGTAAVRTDYVQTSGTATFAPGVTTATFPVTINGDTADEPDETFLVGLANPSGATIADDQATGTIVDDDDPPPANRSPNASFTMAPGSGTTATSFAFDGRGSSDPDGDALTYAWSFGDGAGSTGATPAHSYAAAGSYTATLTVSDGRGGTNATSRTVVVSAVPAPVESIVTGRVSSPRVFAVGDGDLGQTIPVNGAQVSLLSKSGAVLVQTQSDTTGRYRLAALPGCRPGGSSRPCKVRVDPAGAGSVFDEPVEPAAAPGVVVRDVEVFAGSPRVFVGGVVGSLVPGDRRPVQVRLVRVSEQGVRSPLAGAAVTNQAGAQLRAVDAAEYRLVWAPTQGFGPLGGVDVELLVGSAVVERQRVFSIVRAGNTTRIQSEYSRDGFPSELRVPTLTAPRVPISAALTVIGGRVFSPRAFAVGEGELDQTIPASGAAVRLLSKHGTALTQTQSDADGRYQLGAPAACQPGGSSRPCKLVVDPSGPGSVFDEPVELVAAPGVVVRDVEVFAGTDRVFVGGSLSSLSPLDRRPVQVRLVRVSAQGVRTPVAGASVTNQAGAALFRTVDGAAYRLVWAPILGFGALGGVEVELLVSGVVIERQRIFSIVPGPGGTSRITSALSRSGFPSELRLPTLTAPPGLPPAGSSVIVGRVFTPRAFAVGDGELGQTIPVGGAQIRLLSKTGAVLTAFTSDGNGWYQLAAPAGCQPGGALRPCKVVVDPAGPGPVFDRDVAAAAAPGVQWLDVEVFAGAARVFVSGLLQSVLASDRRRVEVRLVRLNAGMRIPVAGVSAFNQAGPGQAPRHVGGAAYRLVWAPQGAMPAGDYAVELVVEGVVVERQHAFEVVLVAQGTQSRITSDLALDEFRYEMRLPVLTAP